MAGTSRAIVAASDQTTQGLTKGCSLNGSAFPQNRQNKASKSPRRIFFAAFRVEAITIAAIGFACPITATPEAGPFGRICPALPTPSNRRRRAGVPLLYCVALSQMVVRLCSAFRTPAAPHPPVARANICASAKRTQQHSPALGALLLRLPVSQQGTAL